VKLSVTSDGWIDWRSVLESKRPQALIVNSAAPTSGPDSAPANDREQTQLDNLADHIRTVHFTVLVLCLVLLAATLQEHRNPFPRALDDLKAIIGLSSGRSLGKKITERVRNFGDQKFQMGRPLFVRVKVRGKQELYRLTFDAPWAYQDYRESSVTAGYFSSGDRSLRDFSTFWNHNKEQRVYLIGRIKNPAEIEASETRNVHNRKGPIQHVAFTVDLIEWISTGSTEKVDVLDGKSAQTAPNLTLDAEWEKDQLVLRTFDLDQLSSADFEIRPHVTPLSRAVINVQDLLRTAAGKKSDWILGDFTATFTDLNQAGGKLAAMPLLDLQQELNRQSTDEDVRDAEKLEIFGAKIPVKQVSNWGIVLLAGSQFYLWLYLDALRRLVQASTLRLSMNWIGLHEGLPGRTFVLFSVLLLPAAVLGVLVYRGWSASNWVRIPYVTGASISLLLISLTTATLSRIWKRSKP